MKIVQLTNFAGGIQLYFLSDDPNRTVQIAASKGFYSLNHGSVCDKNGEAIKEAPDFYILPFASTMAVVQEKPSTILLAGSGLSVVK